MSCCNLDSDQQYQSRKNKHRRKQQDKTAEVVPFC
jgi:hypothetical protein